MSGPVRTYLDPDARGPLPRYSIADDSDAMAAARTIERRPLGLTQEVLPSDVLEVFEESQRPSSIAPVGYDLRGAGPALDGEPLAIPRRKLGGVVLAVVAVAAVVLVIATIRTRRGDADAAPVAAAESPRPTQLSAHPSPPIAMSATQTSAPADVTTGTLRFDVTTAGHRVWVDGVLLLSDAAIVKCGPHRVRVGSLGSTRFVDVPCGGEVTLGY